MLCKQQHLKLSEFANLSQRPNVRMTDKQPGKRKEILWFKNSLWGI